MTAPTVTTDSYRSERISRNFSVLTGSILFGGTYETNGVSVTAITNLFKDCKELICDNQAGYLFRYDKTNKKLIVYNTAAGETIAAEAAHTHAVALDSGASGAGDSHNHAFTGTSAGDLNYGTPAFTGTGITATAQVLTTTDNQTMALNECAGMWLIVATGSVPPVLIKSNTAVTGAPAVFTVQGVATTDVGVYKVLKNIVPVGTNAAEATHTHASGTLADAASGAGSSHIHTASGGSVAEIANATDLSAVLTEVNFIAVGTY